MKSEAIHVDKYTISYTYRKGKKPLTILLIHGLDASKDLWQLIYNIKELVDYSILVPYLIGYGDSKAPQGFHYTMREQAESLKMLIEAIDAKSNLFFILHSMGGLIGVILAEPRSTYKGDNYCGG